MALLTSAQIVTAARPGCSAAHMPLGYSAVLCDESANTTWGQQPALISSDLPIQPFLWKERLPCHKLAWPNLVCILF